MGYKEVLVTMGGDPDNVTVHSNPTAALVLEEHNSLTHWLHQRYAAQATLALLADASLRARLAANARRLVEERYDWATIGRRFVGLVEGAVARRAVGG